MFNFQMIQTEKMKIIKHERNKWLVRNNESEVDNKAHLVLSIQLFPVNLKVFPINW